MRLVIEMKEFLSGYDTILDENGYYWDWISYDAKEDAEGYVAQFSEKQNLIHGRLNNRFYIEGKDAWRYLLHMSLSTEGASALAVNR